MNVIQELQRELGIRQSDYDRVNKAGKMVKDHAPRSEQAEIQKMNDQLRDKWNRICNAAIERSVPISLQFCLLWSCIYLFLDSEIWKRLCC